MSMPAIELAGKRFGRLMVERRDGSKSTRAAWRCQCDCGQHVTVSSYDLRSAQVASCGCWRRERATALNFDHGEASSETPEYRAWGSMLSRCTNPNDARYKNYGARGIKVCEPWQSYSVFLADMGRRPTPKHSLDRIDNDGNYEPSNCRWATAKQQMNNRRVSKRFEGQPDMTGHA